MAPFSYIGQGLPIEEFEAYVLGYDFGSIPPDFLVIHHTANPAASWAPATGTPNWDANEVGKSTAQIRIKRKAQLDAIMVYYRDTLRWTAGPHLFIDNIYVWLFTPMAIVGVHAASGNSYRDVAGRLHYSLGVEVVGNYASQIWPASIQRMVGRAVVALQRRLKTFDLVYKPAARNRPDLHAGSIAFHRDFNKPECPGNEITPKFVIDVLSSAAGTGTYCARGVPVHQGPSLSFPVALDGTAFLSPGERVEIDEVKAGGWGHLKNGLGFVLLEQLEKVP